MKGIANLNKYSSLFIFCYLFFVIVSCKPEEKSSNLSTNEDLSLKEEFYILNGATKDLIETGTELPPLEGGLEMSERSKYIGEKFKEYEKISEKIALKTNKDSVRITNISSFLIDSISIFSADEERRMFEVENYEEQAEPDTFAVTGERIKVIEPARKAIQPWSQRDNAQFNIRNLSVNESFPSNVCAAIFKDSRSFIWIGTDKGLVQFDGRYVKCYDRNSGIPNEIILRIAEDRLGNLWLGTKNGGLIKYDGTYFYNYSLDDFTTKDNHEITDIEIDENDNIWLTIQFGGLAYFDGKQFISYKDRQGVLTKRPTTSITFDGDKKWVTGFGTRLSYHDEDGITTIGKRHKTLHNYLTSSFLDHQERLWIGGWNNAYWIIDQDSVYRCLLPEQYDCLTIQQIGEDSQNRIWMATGNQGLFMLDDTSVYHFGKENGISSNQISDFYIDDQDKIWIATQDAGISVLDPDLFQLYNTYNGFPNDYFFNVAEKETGDLVAVMDNGIVDWSGDTIDYLVNEKQASIYRRKINFQESTPDVIVVGDTAWATQLNRAVIKISDKNVAPFKSDIGGAQNPTAICQDKNGIIWVAGLGDYGILRIENNLAVGYQPGKQLMLNKATTIFADHENSIWLGTSTNGVIKFNENGITYYTTNEGLYSNIINHISEDDQNRIWISTTEGVNYLENNVLKSVHFEQKNIPMDIRGIEQSNDSKDYWITTDQGMLILRPKDELSEEWKIENYTIQLIDKKDGLINPSFIPNSIFIDKSSDYLYAGTSGGLTKWPIGTDNKKNEKPQVFMESIEINGQAINFPSIDNDKKNGFTFLGVVPYHNYPNELILDYNYNRLKFNFSGLYWDKPEALVYSYYLEGFEENWNVNKISHSAEYKNLSHGQYIFHVKASDPFGETSEILTYSFEVKRAWWNTWIARIIYALIAILLIYLLVQARIKRLKGKQKELENEISLATNEIRIRKNEIETAHNEMKDSIEYAKRIQNAILPSDKLVKEYINDSFIIYKPKDIVAGDFYWMEPKGDMVLLAAADCTGHGVSGAMVSVICNNGLNRSVRESGLTDPGEILNETRKIVVEEFEKSEEDVQDGMDIAFCSLSSSNELKFAGANNPLWIVRKNSNTIEEVKGDKQPIGAFERSKPFTTHTFQLEPGDVFYIFSDGFSDQFGGDKGKKLKTGNFKELLLKHCAKDMQTQKKVIDEFFENWKGNHEQLDDVCLIGVRV